MKSEIYRLSSLRFIFLYAFIAFGILLCVENHRASAHQSYGAEPPNEIYGKFTVGIFEYDPDTPEGELSDLLLNQLWAVEFNAERIRLDFSHPSEVFDFYPDIDFFIVVTVIEGTNPTYNATVYSKDSGDSKNFNNPSQIDLSSAIVKYIQQQTSKLFESNSPESSQNPENKDYFAIAYSAYLQGNYETAIDDFNAVLVEEPDNWKVHYYMYRIYTKLGDTEMQWYHIQAGLDINPNSDFLLLSLGNFYFRSGDYEEAINIYRALLDSDEAGFELEVVRYNLSLAYEKTGEYQRAIEILNENNNYDWGNLKIKKEELQTNLIKTEERIRLNQTIYFSLAGAVLLLGIILLFLFVLQKRKNQIQGPIDVSTEQDLKNALLRTFNEGMNISELRELCFILGLDWENLSGETKNTKAISLIEHFSNRNSIVKLQREIDRIRPDLQERL